MNFQCCRRCRLPGSPLQLGSHWVGSWPCYISAAYLVGPIVMMRKTENYERPDSVGFFHLCGGGLVPGSLGAPIDASLASGIAQCGPGRYLCPPETCLEIRSLGALFGTPCRYPTDDNRLLCRNLTSLDDHWHSGILLGFLVAYFVRESLWNCSCRSWAGRVWPISYCAASDVPGRT